MLPTRLQLTRRQVFQAASAAALLSRCSGPPAPETSKTAEAAPKLGTDRLCFFTDEVSQNLDEAIAFAKEFGVGNVEIRDIDKTYAFMDEPAKLKEIRAKLDDNGLRVAILATPIMKCMAPGFEVAPAIKEEIDAAEGSFPIPREQQFGRSAEFLERAIEAAHILGTDLVRVFGFWRVTDPTAVHGLILEKLAELSPIAEKAGIRLALENESSCSLANCQEVMMVLPKAPANVGMLWDPLNGCTTDEKPYPDGYNLIDKSRLFHVELKDLGIDPATGEHHTVAVGDGVLPYVEIFEALARDGYKGVISMETHFSIDGSREKASRRSMQGILKALSEQGHRV
jgi:L-ribulose-5-phosphate 3-epimerase